MADCGIVRAKNFLSLHLTSGWPLFLWVDLCLMQFTFAISRAPTLKTNCYFLRRLAAIHQCNMQTQTLHISQAITMFG